MLFRAASTLFLLAVAALSVRGSSAAGSTFDVTAYGAVADGKKDCTAAVRRAAAALAANGGGTLLFPSGSADDGESKYSSTYLSGSFNLSSHSTLFVE